MVQTLQPGTPLQGGKYVIKQVLGQGGFGITYLATQVSLDRDVAIKEFFMRDSCLRDEDSITVSVPSTGSAAQVEKYRKKFDKEARTLALLDHPHIVRVIEIFEENGFVVVRIPAHTVHNPFEFWFIIFCEFAKIERKGYRASLSSYIDDLNATVEQFALTMCESQTMQ